MSYVRLADLGQIEAAVGSVIGSALSAGAILGSGFIKADADKYAAKQQSQTQQMILQAQQKAQDEQSRLELELSKLNAQSQEQQVESIGKPALVVVAILGLAAIAAYVALKE